MQHYGAPTRLQDWTHSAYIAFFFSLEKPARESETATVWAVYVPWAQGAMQNCLERTLRMPADKARLQTLGDQERLVAWFRKTNPFPGILPVEPWIYDSRQAAQQSVFLCPADCRRSFVENVAAFEPMKAEPSVIRMSLSPVMRRDGLEDLYRMNITAATLFPGLDGFGRSLRTRVFDPEYKHKALMLALEGPSWLEAKAPMTEPEKKLTDRGADS